MVSSAIPFTPSRSPTALVTKSTIYRRKSDFSLPRYEKKRTMVGRMYVRAPVSSNIMTTTVTVMRMTPLSEERRYKKLTRELLLQRTLGQQRHRGMHKSRELYMGRQADKRQRCQKSDALYRPPEGKLVLSTMCHD